MMRLLFIVMALVWSVQAQAQTIPHTQEWTSGPTPPGWFNVFVPHTVDSSIPSPAGGNALKVTYPAGTYSTSYGPGKTYYVLSPTQPEIYIGFWFRWSVPFDFNPNSTKIYYQYGTGTTQRTGSAPKLTVRTSIPLGTSVCCDVDIEAQGPEFPQGLVGNTLPHTLRVNRQQVGIGAGVWRWLEVHSKANSTPTTADGVLEVWVDDVPVMQHLNVMYFDKAGAKWSEPSLAPEWGGSGGTIHQTQDIRYDHVVIQATPIGRPGGGGIADTTIPSVPVISVASSTINSATVSITTPSTDNALAQYVLRRCTGVACVPSVTLAAPVPSAFPFIDSNVSPGQTYVYDMRGVDTSGNASAFSATKSVTIGTGGSTTTTIAFDAASISAAANTTNSVTWNHTTGTGSNRLLTVCAQARDTVTAGDIAVTGITYAGLPLTKIRSDQIVTGGFNLRTELWNLIAPASGTGAIAITWTGALNNYGVGSAATYTGVTQTSFNDADAGANGSTANPSVDITTVTDGSMIVDCMLDSSNGQVVGAGQTQRANRDTTANTDGTGMSETAKATAGVETMSWTVPAGGWAISSASFKPGVVVSTPDPTITGLSFTSSGGSLTGFDITVGATPPTYVLAQVYTSQGIYSSVEYAYSAFTAGHLALTVPDGVEGLCVYPRNASHVTTPNGQRCLPFGSLVGPIDTTAPTLSNPQPSGTLPAGTIVANVSVTVSKPASCLLSVSNLSYAAMLAAGDNTTMSGVVPVVSADTAVAAGLNNLYVACRFTDVNGDTHDSTTLAFIVTVAAAPQSDTTKPSDVSGVSATVTGATAVQINFTLPTDDVALLQTEVFLSFDGTTYFRSATVASPTHTVSIPGLLPNTLYYTKLQARDTSSNVSLNFSTPVTFTTDRLVDVTPPSTMAHLRVEAVFTSGATLKWDDGTDTGFGSDGTVTSTIELGLSTGGICGAYTQVFTRIAQSFFTPNLTPGTAYCARGLHTDQQGNKSVDFSNVVTFTTATAGLAGPRAEVPPGLGRSSVNRATPGARAVRP